MVVPCLLLFAPSHARAAMRTEVSRAMPGKPFLAAVEIDTDPHWHVYWRNPGDSGIPTKIDWRVPKGWRIEPLEFPTPRRFAPGGITAYGYEGKTLFLARVTPSRTSGAVSASVKWLVCSEACIAGGATVASKVALGTAKPTTMATTLQASQKALPRPGAERVSTRIGKGVVLAATFSPDVALPSWWSKAEFFPLESGIVDQGRPLLATLRSKDLVFKMDVSPFPEKHDRLSGLVVFSSGNRRQAVLVTSSLEKETQP